MKTTFLKVDDQSDVIDLANVIDWALDSGPDTDCLTVLDSTDNQWRKVVTVSQEWAEDFMDSPIFKAIPLIHEKLASFADEGGVVSAADITGPMWRSILK